MNSFLEIDFIMLYGFITLMACVLIFSFIFNKKRKMKKFLNKLPQKKISSLKVNELSKVSGNVKAIEEPLIAPLSKTPCVYYNLKVEEQLKSGKNKHWKAIIKKEKIQDFFVEEHGSTTMVITENTGRRAPNNILIHKKNKASSKIDNEYTEALQIILKDHPSANKKTRCIETYIEVGQKITVVGTTTYESLQKPLKGYSYSKIMSLKSTNEQKLVITDITNTSKE